MQEGLIYSAFVDGSFVLKFVGDVRLTLCASLDCHLDKVLDQPDVTDILIDLTQAEGIDSTSLGLIAKLSIKANQRDLGKPTLVSTDPDITRILYTMGFDHIFILLEELPLTVRDLQQLPLVQESVDEMKERIISAHRVLMTLNETNREAFKDLVSTLEAIDEK
ncbi:MULTISPECIES: STAS domain-containing protein [unclassified Neptuniibacter]|uniref:STAS domain-containing protein n=1 Tax=unclassified Neptuniibacter TaxID=2630693 RepID=UPI0025DD5990|nr:MULTISPECIES: STAS domain-containing protein [unclassified Neptuniibacter]|tara:strand:- start:30497 stop:30988 length:492 start_codon:yes stop_codon:yes gene_type:complete